LIEGEIDDKIDSKIAEYEIVGRKKDGSFASKLDYPTATI
jgi:hypothetical protein